MGNYDSELAELLALNVDFVSVVEDMFNHGEITETEYKILTQKKINFINSITEKVY